LSSRARSFSGPGSTNLVGKSSADGLLHRLHRGVYAVGHRSVSPEGRWMAAVLACGGGAVLGHLAAATLWGWLRADFGSR
jgi:hypothetical protein